MTLHPSDPETQYLAAAFLAGLRAELLQKETFLRLFHSEEGKQTIAMLAPETGRYYEQRTEAELEDEKQNAAIGVGIAYALRVAIARHEQKSPGTSGIPG